MKILLQKKMILLVYSKNFSFQVSDIQIEESMGEKDNYIPLKATGFTIRLSKYTVRFTMKDGVVTSINPSVESTRADVLNIQRGILSMIQIRQVKNELNVVEVKKSLFTQLAE